MTEISTDDNGQESTEIQAEFPWGRETIEIIRNISSKMFDNLCPQEQEMFLVSVKLTTFFLIYTIKPYNTQLKSIQITKFIINKYFFLHTKSICNKVLCIEIEEYF